MSQKFCSELYKVSNNLNLQLTVTDLKPHAMQLQVPTHINSERLSSDMHPGKSTTHDGKFLGNKQVECLAALCRAYVEVLFGGQSAFASE